MTKYFEFEKSIEDIDSKIERLENKNHDNDLDLINKYKQEKKNLFKNIYDLKVHLKPYCYTMD